MSEPPRALRVDEKATLDGLSSWPPRLCAPGARESSIINGRYALVRPLGTGGLGTVWEAEDHDSGRHVALKLPRPEVVANIADAFRREAQVLGALAHTNIVRLLAHGVDEELGPYLAMELLSGPSLEDEFAVGRRRSLPEILEWLAPVADALEVLHGHGLVHRDVKPANVVRDGEGVVKIVDFGLVAHADGRDQRTRGRVAGTPHYLAPEVARGGIATAASDVYALAVVAFELLTGRLPHDETTAAEIMRAKVARPAPSLGKTSGTHFAPKLERAMEAALNADPGERPSPAEFIARLRACLR